jgi:hypothetical protein
MEIDPIEIRLGNLFEYRRQVKEISMADLAQLEALLPELKPIPITSRYLMRLNFVTVTDNESVRHFQKYCSGIYFNLYPKKDGSFVLYVNTDLKLPQVKAIHQLQNVYYELTGDIFKRAPGPRLILPEEDRMAMGQEYRWEKRSGPGKYRSRGKE